MSTLRVAIIEDDPRYRESLEMLFSLSPGFELIDTFDDAARATSEAARRAASGQACPWDVVVTDMKMPRMDGIEGTRRLKAAYADVKVLVLTVYEEPRTILEAIIAGADGYLLKHSPVEELVEQVRVGGLGGEGGDRRQVEAGGVEVGHPHIIAG